MTLMTSIDYEADRLEALRRLDLLDSESEPEFDELVMLAAAICDTPISLVTLVDEHRQWFKACVGLDAKETPRSISFCAHAIQQTEMFVVEDAANTPEFAANPLVVGEPKIRFYAGMPIFSADGYAMGTLCVIDREPRHLTEVQSAALKVLAMQVNTKMALRVQRRELIAAQAELQVANGLLREMAVTDSLTGLGNRRVFDERLAAEMTSARRGHDLALLLLDIDHFKARNDKYGHPAGDAALKQLGALLQREVRGTDLVARYGGEEFAVLMRDTSESAALILARRLVSAVEKAEWPDTPMTISVGVAERLTGELRGEQLVAHADAALYLAKMRGRNGVVCRSEML